MAAAVYLFLNLGLFYFAFLINSGAMIVCGLVMAALFLFFFISGLVSARKTHILLSMKDGQLDMTIQKTGILPLTSLKFVFSFLYDQSPEGQEVKGRICFPKGESHAVYPLSIPYSGSGRITADRLKVSDLSGLFSFRRELIERLAREYRVVILAKDTGRVEEFRAFGCEFREIPVEAHGINPLKELQLLSLFKKLLRELKPDIVLTYTIKPNVYAGMACASLGIPYVANITGLGTAVENGGMMQKLTLALYKRGLRKAQMVFFQNQENQRFLLERGIVKGRYDLLPGSGVNLSRYQVLPYPQGETEDFVFIGRLIKEKGIDLELVKKDQNMTDVDDFDFICHIAFNQKPLTRRERAENVKKRDIFGKYGDAAREVINALLDKYAELGIYDIESTEILKQNPFTKYGKPARIAALFGGNDKYRQALREIESELYRVA